MKENSIKNSLSLCLYRFLKDCVTNCIKKYELFQQIKMFSETDTQTSWQTNFNICPVIIFVNKIGLGKEMMLKPTNDAKTLQIGLGLFLHEVCFILKWAPPCRRAVPPSWMLLMVLLSPKEAVMLGKPICFNITLPSCI